jgi:hypothetical protein
MLLESLKRELAAIDDTIAALEKLASMRDPQRAGKPLKVRAVQSVNKSNR